MSAAEAITVHTDDGWPLILHHVPAVGARRGVCLCTHAMMANSRYFRSGPAGGFAGHLAGRGIEVYTLDWRGHGASRPTDGLARHSWSFDDYVHRDAPAAVRAVCQHAGIVPEQLMYLGHSLGGLVGLAALASAAIPPMRALGLWATSLWLPGPDGPLARRLIMRGFDVVSRPLGYAPVRALRFGSDDEPRSYVQQLTGWARTGSWRGRDGTDYLAQLWRIETPVWAASGDGDRLCRPDDARVMLARVRNARPLRRVGRAAGDALNADHFTLFTRSELAPVWDEFIDFASAESRR